MISTTGAREEKRGIGGVGQGLPDETNRPVSGPTSLTFAPWCSPLACLICARCATTVVLRGGRPTAADNAAEVGKHLMQELERLKQRHALIGDVRGRGLAIGVELVSDRASKGPARTETALAAFRAFELGLVL